MEIAFASPAFHYQSYSDLHKVFSQCGVRHVKFGKIRKEDDCAYVYSPANGELEGIKKAKRKCKLIWWFLERIGTHNPSDNFKRAFQAGHFDGMIVSDMGYYDFMRSQGINVAFCPIGYHSVFGEPNWNHHKEWDFCHLSYADVWRRSKLMTKFRNKKLKIAPNGWGEKRRLSLHGSRFLVNTHQDDTNAIEPLRLILAVCHGIPIISESIDRPRPYQGGKMLGSKYENIADNVSRYVTQYKKSPEKFKNQARENYKYFREQLPFFPLVQKAVKELLR